MTGRRRRRLILLAVLGGAVTGIAVYRRAQLERNGAEFRRRYG